MVTNMYARFSSHDQRADAELQLVRLAAKAWPTVQASQDVRTDISMKA